MICPKCKREVSKDEQRVMENYNFKNCIFCRKAEAVKKLKPEFRKQYLKSYVTAE